MRVSWHVGKMTESFWNAFWTWSVAREKCNHECTPQEHSFENTFRKSPSSSTKTRISLPVQNWKPWNSRLQDSLEIRWKIIPFWICKVHFFNEKSRHTWPTETTWCQLHGGHVATGRSESVDGFVGVDGFGVQGEGVTLRIAREDWEPWGALGKTGEFTTPP